MKSDNRFSRAHFFKRSGMVALQATLLSSVCASAAMASPLQVPAAAQPSQVEKRFNNTPAPMQNIEMNLPLPGEQKELSKEAQDKLKKVQFVLKEVSIEGATVFKAEELATTYSDLVGQKISLLDAQAIARKITDMYHKAGYVLSQAVVPQQEVKNGVLKIRVVEGFVGGFLIQGDLTPGERKQLSSYAENITRMKPVRTQDLERYLLLMNDLPGSTVKGLLRPSPTQFGAAELVLTATKKAYSGELSVDNRGSKYIGPWQESATVVANSLFGVYDRTQLRVSTANPNKELTSFELQHDEELDDDGTKLSLLASNTHTQPGDALTSAEIVGNSELYELKVSHPFLRSRQENLNGRVLFDWHDSDTNVFKHLDFNQDRLRVGRLGGTYNIVDGWRGNNLVDLQVSKGFDIFNASSVKDIYRTNPLGESDFTKFNLDVSRLQQLPNNFSIFAAASGQYSLDPLFIAEQFSLGGTGFGGAYDPAELLGDQGLAGKLELRYNGLVGDPYFNSYQLFTYYDIGRVWLRDVPSSSNDKKSLASVGGGIRTSFTESLSSSLEVGLPLTKAASNQGGHGDSPRVFFGTTARF